MNAARRRARGFTLLETVVALTLLATLLGLLFAGMRTGLQSWDVGLGRAARADELLLSGGFVRRELAAAFPWRFKDPMAVRLAFSGERERVLFVSQRPAALDGGGLAFVSIEFEHPGAGAKAGRLMMRRTFASADATDFSSLDKAEAFTLLDGVTAFRLRYFGAENDFSSPAWAEKWSATQRLPSHVSVEIELGERRLPVLVVATRLGEEAGCYESMFQRTCVPRR